MSFACSKCGTKAFVEFAICPKCGSNKSCIGQDDGTTMTVKESTEMVPIVRKRRIASSIDVSTPQGKLALYRAVQGGDFTADDVMNQPIEIQDVVMHWVPLPDKQTGEIRDCERTVFISPDGSRTVFVSEGIANSVRALVEIYRNPPWRPPVKAKVIALPAKGMGKYYQLDVLELPE